jgi:putative nucleotidyltransferase with HDIG domain
VSRKRKNQVKPPLILQSLSKPPDGSWQHGAFYHGMRIGLMVLLAVAITLLFPSEVRRTVALYQVGDVATEDVAAEVGFDVPKDSVELRRQQDEAAAAVPQVFEYDPTTEGRIEARLNGFFDRIRDAAEVGGRPAVEEVLRTEGLQALASNSDYFLNPADLETLREACLEAVREYVDRFLESEYGNAALSAGQIHRWGNGIDLGPVNASDLLWGTDFITTVVGSLGARTSQFQAIARSILIYFFESPYSLDRSRTEARLAEARSAVPTTERTVVQGEYIVRRGDQVGPSEQRALIAHSAALQSRGLIREMGRDWSSSLGGFLLNVLFLSIFGFLLFFYRREVYGSFRWVLLLACLVFVYFLAAAGIVWQGYPSELLPIAFVILPVAILWDGRMALILALVLGVLSAVQGPFNSFPILGFTLIGGAAAALSARAVRRRSQTWIFIALITLGYALASTAFGLIGEGEAPSAVLVSILFGGLNATVSAILAMGFMPVFEWFTGITTDQTLLEWADPNRPLLKSLSLEASGTYAHTINVANLAEAAATAIGGNGLLARVGVYYHDVGKMLKPQYFVENQPGGRNPHDKLKPHTSAAIVREHVIEGERMARAEGVPDVVARFIPEHHGTQLIGFFYEKAREESTEEPDQGEFRYPGPKPRSKETAIAMLADSVESATRALQDGSPERVRELVKTIVDGKIRDGQLSDAPLTLQEIAIIQEQFVKVVGGMFHHRLDYPATRHITLAPKGEPDTPEEASPARAKSATANPPRVEEQLPLTPADESPPDPSENGG